MNNNDPNSPKYIVVKDSEKNATPVFSAWGIATAVIILAVLISVFGILTVFTDIEESEFFAPITLLIIAVVCVAAIISQFIAMRNRRK